MKPLRLTPIFAILVFAAPLRSQDCVVLLHGLARSENSMNAMETHLKEAGFEVYNTPYPSRDAQIEELADEAVAEGLSACATADTTNFVTHSMGGILVRDYFARHEDAKRPFRVVMLAPPNHGSEIIDDPRYETVGAWWNGPAGWQLSAKPESYVNQLPAVDYPVGVIAGSASIEPYTADILPGDDDGKVSVASTKLDGMADWIVIHSNHTFIMNNDDVQRQTLYFLQNGRFQY